MDTLDTVYGAQHNRVQWDSPYKAFSQPPFAFDTIYIVQCY